MSNMATIYITKFVDLSMTGEETGEVSYALRVLDNYSSSYIIVDAKEDIIGKTPMELIELVCSRDETASEIIGSAQDNNDGIFIGDTFYAWADMVDN
jgi:hypothetical protein